MQNEAHLMSNNSGVVDIDVVSDPIITSSQSLHIGTVRLPKDGITIDKNANRDLVALFEYEFEYIQKVTVLIEFEDNLYDQSDIWVINNFGAQRNEGASITETSQTQTKCLILQKFANGRFRFNIKSDSGTMTIKQIKFILIGLVQR